MPISCRYVYSCYSCITIKIVNKIAKVLTHLSLVIVLLSHVQYVFAVVRRSVYDEFKRIRRIRFNGKKTLIRVLKIVHQNQTVQF